jgi:hypothetical protein
VQMKVAAGTIVFVVVVVFVGSSEVFGLALI